MNEIILKYLESKRHLLGEFILNQAALQQLIFAFEFNEFN